MKKLSLLTVCLLFFFVEAQQQKPKSDSSWNDIKKSLGNLSKTVKQVKKQGVKKPVDISQAEIQTIYDTIYTPPTPEDSLNIFNAIKEKQELENKTEIKKISSIGKFLRSLSRKKKTH